MPQRASDIMRRTEQTNGLGAGRRRVQRFHGHPTPGHTAPYHREVSDPSRDTLEHEVLEALPLQKAVFTELQRYRRYPTWNPDPREAARRPVA